MRGPRGCASAWSASAGWAARSPSRSPAPGTRCVAVSAVSAQSRDRAERMLPGAPVRPLDETVRAADFVLLAVPDDVLRPLVAGLADTDTWRAGQLAAHTSGAHGIGVLDPAAARDVARAGAAPGDDVHRPSGGPRPARRRDLRRHRAGRTAPGRRVARRRDGRRAGVGARAGPSALPRRAHHRVQPSRHARQRRRRGVGRGGRGRTRAGCSRRCSARRWTTCSGSATRR